jgi:putative colanic acid biosynthesis acetyltransferase WcaF
VSPLPSDKLAPTAVAPPTEGAAPAAPASSWVDLGSFDNPEYNPGRGLVVRTLWYYVSVFIFESGWLPVSGFKCRLLRLFGARIGRGVSIKPQVRIKYPWRLSIGDHCWIGQETWIDNIADVTIGSNVCISQLAYLCTGSHDYRRKSFDLISKPITIGDGAWIGARALILPGVTIGANGVAAGGSVVTKDVAPATIVAGNPARPIAGRPPPVG